MCQGHLSSGELPMLAVQATQSPPLSHNRFMETITKEVDARGLNCPLPILKAKKALADVKSGELLRIICTDPGSVRDFQAFARQTKNELVEQTESGDEFIHVLRRR